MRSPYQEALCDAAVQHPAIAAAALTGSHARQHADAYSDLDLLLIAEDVAAVRAVRRWVPEPERLLIAAFHRTHYATLLRDDFEKADLAIFSLAEPPSAWVVHDFQILKGGAAFADKLAAAAAHTRTERAAHHNPDASLDNVLLLLATAQRRRQRGELLSAHHLLAMAADLFLAYRHQHTSLPEEADWLDPRRRLEHTTPALAQRLHQALFAAPDAGIPTLAQILTDRYGSTLTEAQRRVVAHLLRATPPR